MCVTQLDWRGRKLKKAGLRVINHWSLTHEHIHSLHTCSREGWGGIGAEHAAGLHPTEHVYTHKMNIYSMCVHTVYTERE